MFDIMTCTELADPSDLCSYIMYTAVLVLNFVLSISSLQLKVRPRDIQLCQETSSGVDASGHYQLGDLVQLE